MTRFLMIAAIAIAIYGCDDILTNQYPYGNEFVLGHQQRALVGGESLIRFLGVPEDSRCPTSVTCVWEGNARAEFELRVSGYDPVRFSLNTHEQFQRTTTINGVTVTLLEVAPYPERPGGIDPQDYTVRIVLNK